MYYLELIKFDVSNSYYVEVKKTVHCCTTSHAVMENDPWKSWKVIEKSLKTFREKLWEPCACCENILVTVCHRETPDEVGIDEVAAHLKKNNIHGLLVVGGFEVLIILSVFELLSNKKYVPWNAGICPIAEIVRNTTFDDHIKSHDR